jgi:hypothetical protein
MGAYRLKERQSVYELINEIYLFVTSSPDFDKGRGVFVDLRYGKVDRYFSDPLCCY